MHLDKLPPQGRKPLRTVSEIAEILGVTTQKLGIELKDPTAPERFTASYLGHTVAGKNRVWYEPKAVIKWWKMRNQA